jgi:hypothetical protein
MEHFDTVCCKEHVNLMTVLDGLRSTGYADNALTLINVWVCYNFDEELFTHVASYSNTVFEQL